MTANGNEEQLLVCSDAGFAGADTKSQNGLIIFWAGSIITWRSSRAALSGLSAAEAELCAAALGWQVTEGVRYLLSTLHIFPGPIDVMIHNKAALTAASLGATWRTRYFAVRAKRLLEENAQGRVLLTHCPTKDMVDGGRRIDKASRRQCNSSTSQCDGRLSSYKDYSTPDLSDARTSKPM